VECIGLIAFSSVTNRQWSLLWLIPVAVVVYVLLALFAVRRAGVAAVEWGSFVKAQFDTILPVLGKSLELPATATREKQRELWQLYSNVITYRSEADLHKLDDEIDRLTGKSPPRQELPEGSPQEALQSGTTEETVALDQSNVEEPQTLKIAFVAIPKDGLIGRTLRAIFLSSSQD
jgi:hypothetical protein